MKNYKYFFLNCYDIEPGQAGTKKVSLLTNIKMY